MSPSRPHSLRKRQSLQLVDLESRVNQLAQENRQLQEARTRAERIAQDASTEKESHAITVRNATDAVAQRDLQIREKDEQIQELREELEITQNEVARLAQEHARLSEHNRGLAESVTDERFTSLQSEHDNAHSQWQTTLVALAALQAKHKTMEHGMEQIVRDEIEKATADQAREIGRLQAELDASMAHVEELQKQLLAARQADDDFLAVKDEDYFEGACEQLCSHIQQWVLRFSKFSDSRQCRLSSDIKDKKIEDRLDDTILDGSDVDALLNDRIKRRDIFMSITVSMIWEYIFTRYLFGLDQSQRQTLKKLEKNLSEIGK
jgi:chromosome segregation ATPase